MQAKNIFSSHPLGQTFLKNRVVMAPMTRSRALNNQVNELVATYYSQRSSAGLIVTEGVSPSPNGLGYARIPGIFTKEQTQAWRKVTDAVHEKEGKIFIQLMHTGRISHAHNLPVGGRVVAPSAVVTPGQMWTDREGMKEFPIPQEMTAADILNTKEEFVQAALNAIEAGFDGVELHAANGYLLEQFLSPHTNRRTDTYGGSIENRTRFVLGVAREISDYIGNDKVGVRLSPFSEYNDMHHYDELAATYIYLAEQLNKIGLAYLHLVDGTSGSEAYTEVRKTIREKFSNTLIHTGGYTLHQAEQDLNDGVADLVGFGKPFINNPDLVERFQRSYPLNSILDFNTFYSTGQKGYIDYPVYADELVSA